MFEELTAFFVGFSLCGVIGCWIVWKLRDKLEESVNKILQEIKMLNKKIDNLK